MELLLSSASSRRQTFPTLAETIRSEYDLDEAAAINLASTFTTIPAGGEIISNLARAKYIFGIREGLAIRHRGSSDGMRHILGFLMPGDICNPNPFAEAPLDHTVEAITSVVVERVLLSHLQILFIQGGGGQRHLWEAADRESTALRDRLELLGRRDARMRVIELLSDLVSRLIALHGMQSVFLLPLTQSHIADASGLTHVHVNRILRGLRDLGIVTTHRGSLAIRDAEALLGLARSRFRAPPAAPGL